MNLPGGLWTIQCDQYVSYNCTLPASGYFLNLGTIQKKAGTGTTYIYIPVDNLGAVSGLAGTLSFYDGGTIAGSYSAASGAVVGFAGGSFSNATPVALSGPGAIQFSGGSLSLVNDIIPGLQLTGGTVALAPGFQGGVITNLTLSGSTLSGTNTVTGTMNWASGTVAGPLTVAGSGVLNLLGTSPMYLGSALTNAGTVNWTGGGLYLYACSYAPGPVVNLPGGLWSIQCDQYVSYNCTLPASGYFLNLGTIQKKAGTGTTYIYLPFDNLGAVAGLAGTLSFYNGGTISGSYSAASGAVVGFAGGSFSNAVPAALSGPGVIQFSGGSLLLVSNEIPDLAMTGGTVSLGADFQGGTITNLTSLGSTLSGNWTVSGLFNCGGGASGILLVAGGASMNWSGGTISGPLTIAGSGVLNLLGTSAMYLESTLTNAGTVNWTGGSLVLYACGYAPGPVVNLPGALWSVQCDQYVTYSCGLPASSYFLNLGTIQKIAGTGTTSFYIPLDNSGELDAESGTLSFNGSPAYTQTGATVAFGLRTPSTSGHVSVSGNVNLDGTLQVNLLPGYSPSLGDSFSLLSYGSYAGSFNNLDLASPGTNLKWRVSYSASALLLQVLSNSLFGQLTGTVRDNQGHGIPQITVFAYTTNTPGLYLSTTTDAAGNYTLGVGNGNWVVGLQNVTGQGYNPVPNQLVLISSAIFNATNLLSNPGAEADTLTNWTVGGSSGPTVDNGSFDPGINPHSGSYDFRGGTGALGSLAQVVPLVGSQGLTATAIDSGGSLALVSFWEQGLNQGTPSDNAYVSLAFWNGASNVISTVSTPEIDSHAGAWSNYLALFQIPAGARYIQYTMDFVRHSGNDLDAFVDDNRLSVALTNAAQVVNFVLQPYTGPLFAITLAVAPPGAGTAAGGGLFTPGSAVTLSATAITNALPYSFSAWTENGLVQASTPTYVFSATRNRQLVANFVLPVFTVSATNNPPAAGSVGGQGVFSYGATNVLTASANFGYAFANWTLNGLVIGTTPLLTNVITSNLLVTANYAAINLVHVVTTGTFPTNLATVAGAGVYTNGQSATISAPLSVTQPPYIYTFRQFQLNGAPAGTNASFSKVFSTTDPTNLQYVADYSFLSLLPLVTNVLANYSPPVPATTNFLLTLQFDRSMDTNVDPLVVVTNPTASVQARVPPGGSWSSTVLTNDTFKVPPITFAPGTDGTNTVLVSQAEDLLGHQMARTNVLTLIVRATPPAFMGVEVVPDVTQSQVSWQTDEAATAQVEYGLTSGYGSLTPLISSLLTNHTVTITGLAPKTLYHFRLRATDLAGNLGLSADGTFTTLPDLTPPDTFLTGGPAQNSTACSLPVRFTWSGTDNVTAPTNLLFAFQMDGGGFSAFANVTTTSFSHLADGSHVFQVEAKDQAGNVDPTPATVDFTLRTQAPVLSSIAATATAGQAVITWMTDVPASSDLDYGFTSAYGLSAPAYQGAPQTNHSLTLNNLFPGTNYHFRVRSIDPCARETDSADHSFTTLPAPDLQVPFVSAPPSVWTGSGFDVTWIVTNTGPAAATNAWSDGVYLCSSSSPCTTYLLGTFSYTNGLASGASVTRIQAVTIDRTRVTNANYYITVVADVFNQIYEGPPGSPAETNNAASSAKPVLVQITPLPDLVISEIDAPTNGVYAGQTITLSWTECNIGDAYTDVPLWHDHVWLYSDTNLTHLAQDYGTFPNPSFLGPGECYEQTVNVALPVGLLGPYYFVVEANADKLVLESNSANNLAIATNPTPVLYVAPGFLHVVSVSVAPSPPTAVWTGDSLTVTWTIQNTGPSPITGLSWVHAVAVSPVPSWPSSNSVTVLGRAPFTPPLLPGQSYSRQTVITMPPGFIGTNYVVVIPDHQYHQPNVGRDQGAAPILVAPPLPADLQVTSVVAPASGFVGQPITVSWTVANFGLAPTFSINNVWQDSVYLSSSPVFNLTNATLLASVAEYGPLDVSSNYTQTAVVRLPAVSTQTNYLFFYTDSNGAVYEGPFTTNNVTAAPGPILILPPPPVAPAALEVTALTVQAPAVAGLARTISWTVQNIGGTNTPPGNWLDSVYLSTDGTLNPGAATLLGNFASPPAGLAPGAAYTQSPLVQMPACSVGSYYVVILADSTNHLDPGTPVGTNNVRHSDSPVNIISANLGRLLVQSITAVPAATAGEPLGLAWTVINPGGTVASGPWLDMVYLSSEPEFNPATALPFGAVAHTTNLLPDQVYTQGLTNPVPLCAAGSLYIFVVTDATNHVDPLSCETNNFLQSPFTVAVTGTEFASLRVASLQVPSNVLAGTTFPVSWVVTNAGSATARGTWVDTLYFATTNGLMEPSVALDSVTNLGPLLPGAAYAQTVNVQAPSCISGPVEVCVVVDGSNEVTSAGCAPFNRLCAPIQILPGNPNLQFTALSKPPSVVSGVPFTMSWTVQNAGNTPAVGPWTDAVFLSANANFDARAFLADTEIHTNTLAAGDSYTQNASVLLPGSLAGTFYVFLFTDVSNLVQECTAQRNNMASSQIPLQVVPSLYPDLVVSDVVAPPSGISGQPLTVSWTVANAGTAATPPAAWYDVVYLSTDQVLDSSDLVLDSFARPYSLAPGDSYTQTVDVQMPPGDSGPYYLIVFANANGILNEYGNTANNVAVTPTATILSIAPAADLAPTSITLAPATGVPGQSVTLSYQVMNLATNPAVGTWKDGLFLSPSPGWEPGAVLLGDNPHSGSVAPGASYSDSLTAPLPALTPGNYYALIRANIRDNLRELTLTNNLAVSAAPILVDIPALTLGTPLTNTLSTGTEWFYKVQVGAGDALSISLNSSSPTSANQLYARFSELPDLSHFDFSYSQPLAANQQIVVPTTQAGWYYILVRGASVPDAPAAFSLLANLIPLSITSVSPTIIGDYGQVTLTITGARFQPGATIQLVSGTNTLVPTNVTLPDSSTANARFYFNAAPPARGTYDVQLLNPDRTTAAAPGAVTIQGATGISLQMTTSESRSPRSGTRWDVPCTLVNSGNVDAPYVMVVSAISGQYPMGWLRDAGTFPRQSDSPGVDWFNASPSATTRGGITMDAFWIRNLAPRQKANFVWRVNGIAAGPFKYQLLYQGRTADEMASFLATYVGLVRAAGVLNPANVTPDLLQLVNVPVDWGTFWQSVYVAGGLMDGNEAGWNWVTWDVRGSMHRRDVLLAGNRSRRADKL